MSSTMFRIWAAVAVALIAVIAYNFQLGMTAFRYALAGFGGFAIVAAVLLALGRVSPGRFWGHSALSSLLMGVSMVLIGVAGIYDWPTWPGMLLIAVGVIADSRARRRIESGSSRIV